MAINIKVSNNSHTLPEWHDLPKMIKREFSYTCATTSKDAMIEIPFSIPAGYQVLCVPEIKSVGFVSHFYVETAERSKIRVWGNTNKDKSVVATVIFVKQSEPVA